MWYYTRNQTEGKKNIKHWKINTNLQETECTVYTQNKTIYTLPLRLFIQIFQFYIA